MFIQAIVDTVWGLSSFFHKRKKSNRDLRQRKILRAKQDMEKLGKGIVDSNGCILIFFEKGTLYLLINETGERRHLSEDDILRYLSKGLEGIRV